MRRSAWLSTVRADGRPHVTPVIAVWTGDAVHVCTGPAEQKAKNLISNSNVVVMTGTNLWSGLDVVVEGKAVRVTDDSRRCETWPPRGKRSTARSGTSTSPTARSITTPARPTCSPSRRPRRLRTTATSRVAPPDTASERTQVSRSPAVCFVGADAACESASLPTTSTRSRPSSSRPTSGCRPVQNHDDEQLDRVDAAPDRDHVVRRRGWRELTFRVVRVESIPVAVCQQWRRPCGLHARHEHAGHHRAPPVAMNSPTPPARSLIA